MNKEHAFQVVQKKLAEFLSSGNLRERVTQLLAEDENGYISKRDLMEYVYTEESGEALYVPRGGGKPTSWDYWHKPENPSYRFTAGAFYDDETKKVIRVWYHVSDDKQSYNSPLGNDELLNAEDLSIYEPQL